jgi:hypothetical protein
MSIKGPLFEMLNGRNPDILECPPHRFLYEDMVATLSVLHRGIRCDAYAHPQHFHGLSAYPDPLSLP